MSIALQRKVFRHLLYTRWQQLSELHSGDVIVRMLRDTDALVGFFVSSSPQPSQRASSSWVPCCSSTTSAQALP